MLYPMLVVWLTVAHGGLSAQDQSQAPTSSIYKEPSVGTKLRPAAGAFRTPFLCKSQRSAQNLSAWIATGYMARFDGREPLVTAIECMGAFEKDLQSGELVVAESDVEVKVLAVVRRSESGSNAMWHRMYTSSYGGAVQVEVLKGPEAGKEMWISTSWLKSQLFHALGETIYARWQLVDEAQKKPIELAFTLQEAKAFIDAETSGDDGRLENFRKDRRVFAVSVDTPCKVIELESGLAGLIRIEVLSGPMKGKKGWGSLFMGHGRPSSEFVPDK